MFALGRKPILVSSVYAAQRISKEEGCFTEAALFLLYISPEKSKLRRNPTPLVGFDFNLDSQLSKSMH